MTTNTWLLVADRARARIFEFDADDASLRELASYANPEARLPGRELETERRTRSHESVGDVRHAMEPRSTAAEKVGDRFARELGKALEHGRIHHRYGRLLVVAPPAFLGLLLQRMGKQVRELVAARLDKDLSNLPATDIRTHLKQLLVNRTDH
jgi:protein required for attachment to host cells